MALWLVRLSPDRAVWVRRRPGRGQCVVFLGIGEFNAGGNPAMDWHPIQGGVEILLVASCHRNRS